MTGRSQFGVRQIAGNGLQASGGYFDSLGNGGLQLVEDFEGAVPGAVQGVQAALETGENLLLTGVSTAARVALILKVALFDELKAIIPNVGLDAAQATE